MGTGQPTTSKKDAGSLHCPISSWNLTLLSTSSIPSSARRMPARSRGPRGRAFEIDSGDVEARAVAGTFEFPFPLQPARRAAQVRADRDQGVNQVLPLVPVGVDDPHAVLRDQLRGDRSQVEIGGRPDLELAGRLGQNVGQHEPRRGQRRDAGRRGQHRPGRRHTQSPGGWRRARRERRRLPGRHFGESCPAAVRPSGRRPPVSAASADGPPVWRAWRLQLVPRRIRRPRQAAPRRAFPPPIILDRRRPLPALSVSHGRRLFASRRRCGGRWGSGALACRGARGSENIGRRFRFPARGRFRGRLRGWCWLRFAGLTRRCGGRLRRPAALRAAARMSAVDFGLAPGAGFAAGFGGVGFSAAAGAGAVGSAGTSAGGAGSAPPPLRRLRSRRRKNVFGAQFFGSTTLGFIRHGRPPRHARLRKN